MEFVESYLRGGIGMTTFQIWILIFSGFTAIGTVSAVIISLWVTLHRLTRFDVKGIRVYRLIKADKTEENTLFILFDNRQNIQMEILKVELAFNKDSKRRESRQDWTFKNEFIPPLSQYEIKIPLHRAWAPDSLRKSDRIDLTIKTSFGNKTIPFPKKYKEGLFDSIEFKKGEST